jgi:hypothetical protein
MLKEVMPACNAPEGACDNVDDAINLPPEVLAWPSPGPVTLPGRQALHSAAPKLTAC